MTMKFIFIKETSNEGQPPMSEANVGAHEEGREAFRMTITQKEAVDDKA